jgi:two-component system sensor histidine kinase YesM
LCILLPIISINLFFYQRNSADIKIREEDNLRKSIERAAGELQGMIDESVALSHSIANDDSIYEALDRSYNSPVDYYDVYHSYLRDKLVRYMSAYPNILEIRVFTDNDTIQTGANYHVIHNLSQDIPWIYELQQSKENIMLVSYEEKSGLSAGQRISIVSKMNTFISYRHYAKYLCIDLNIEKVRSILNRELGSLKLQLVDSGGRVVAASAGADGLPAADPSLPASKGEGNGSVMERALGDSHYDKEWKLIGIADTRHIDALLHDARRSIFWLACFSTVISTLLIYVILRSYHYRVKKLSRHMEKVRSEKFDTIDIQEGRDEIGGLIRTFNVMIGKIHSLIHDVYQLEIRQKSMELERVRTELSMLQSQVNPHFLFNTLNALLVVCTKNGYTEVIEIVKNLSQLMRQMLTRADSLVTVQEELQLTTMYLQIEKFRFGARFDYEFDVDPETLAMQIPHMSIQPLVENACKHGLQAKKDNRTIRIEVKWKEREMEVGVIDNGVGMEKEKLARLLEVVQDGRETDGHIGIRNVYRRLELYYHGNFRFLMRSEPGVGTTAGFRLSLAGLLAEGRRKEA